LDRSSSTGGCMWLVWHPAWWMRIRTPLSVGLGGLTLVIGIFA
jgi:hypothetical protein